MLWFEDAIARYVVPTVVFDLHLIVPNVSEAAATVLFSATEWGIKAEMLLNACEHEFYTFLPLLPVDTLINQLGGGLVQYNYRK